VDKNIAGDRSGNSYGVQHMGKHGADLSHAADNTYPVLSRKKDMTNWNSLLYGEMILK